MPDRFLRSPEVTRRGGKRPAFSARQMEVRLSPTRRVIGGGIVGWLESEVQAWIESRPPADSNRAA
jgi:predicted DNA-binding transcriptional regulator AlpA